ncbi:hypothetical protein LTR10_021573 [Elasticomyces elasticus]|uniref:NACHT domain-containing protein n=1 Tax=Exophiala sideris TaxID=1016849 RepID=A0ABR0J7Y3_9EURO|nr:hypothetical protein LTR10_021573 [Elasticomyces elasticus]KAK5029887.1 hypothetical protein LTS07_005611 [Exophiala sideris]KAK5031673.1 hypothetical protein LTR13_007663 [Exophiala sideris]KAK5058351.1 hypothetical protein LTR69_006756 [Exophiala sideris]KAK5180280.1 hypothetical protein LTR44_007406 [Eurotiomycetes sp. CCFEE 6388]
MEGVVALGFACNVIQLIDNSYKTIEIYKHIRENGTTAQVENLIQSIEKLSGHSAALQQSLNGTLNSSSLLKSDVDLLELCKKCSNVVQPLEQEFAALSIGPASGRKDAMRQFFKLKRKAARIEKAKHELDACVQELDSSILIHLSQNMGTLAGQHRQILDEFEDSQRKLASDILNGNTVVRDLLETLSDQGRAHVTQEHTLTRQHIDTQFASLAQRQAYQAGFDDFLASLHYPEITLRQDTISDAHRKTFEWIFDRTSHEGRSWSNFAEWAHSNEQLYWVLGKPGSGKSTLMNFLVSDPRLTSALDDGCGNDDVFVMSFFFWEAGIDLQKNRAGLLRSLIWQLLRLLDPSTALLLYADVVRPKHPRPVTWTPKQLLSLLSSLTGNIPQRIFLFLDGLDEFKDVENECDAIGDVIDLLRQQKNVKICISSRPAACLEELYSVCPSLHLQDLTKSDISRYVEDKLSEAAISRPGMRSALRERSDLVSSVISKAQGVFLWVRLAVQSLIRGIRIEDHWPVLEARLERMPEGIFNLYTHMWQRMKIEADHSFNAKEAAIYLQLVRTFGQLSLLEFAIAASPEPQNVYLKNMDP